MKSLLFPFLFAVLAVGAQTTEKTIRICDETGCSERPRSSSTFDATHDDHPEETRRIAALTQLANKDPKAAFDLGLRYFRGDGIKRDSYQALRWMREAGDHGNQQAQLALGRFYLMGLEEMGSDPQEAEKWLLLASGSGSREAKKLLAEAQDAKKTEQDNYQWRESQRKSWASWWTTGYAYYWVWGPSGWYYR